MNRADDSMFSETSGTDSDHLSESEAALSSCSTSESEMSNSFLDEVFMGHYEGWTHEHDRWLGRWVRDDQMKELLFSLQAFQFLDLQTFLSARRPIFEPESFAKGTKRLDEFLADAELDIVGPNKRFPEQAYHFIDDAKWTRTIIDLYTAIKYVQQTDIDLIHFYNSWTDAIVPAITKNLPDRITREKFESANGLAWSDPSLERAASPSIESDSKDTGLEPCDAVVSDCLKPHTGVDRQDSSDPKNEE